MESPKYEPSGLPASEKYLRIWPGMTILSVKNVQNSPELTRQQTYKNCLTKKIACLMLLLRHINNSLSPHSSKRPFSIKHLPKTNSQNRKNVENCSKTLSSSPLCHCNLPLQRIQLFHTVELAHCNHNRHALFAP